MARPNLRKICHLQRPDPDFSFIPGPSLLHPLSNPTPIRPLIQLSQGQTLGQHHNLPINVEDRLPLGEEPVRQDDSIEESHAQPWTVEYTNNFDNVILDAQGSRTRRKKENQTQTWLQKTIPSLIQPFMAWICATNNMRDGVDTPTTHECTCGKAGRQCRVRIVRWEGMNAH